MQCRLINHPPIDLDYPSNNSLDVVVTETTVESLNLEKTQRFARISSGNCVEQAKSVHFQTHFAGYMEMDSDAQTVAEYLNTHERWFCHCAQPMKVEPIGNNGYILVIGRFGSFGYEVEPKIAVVLHPRQNGVYWMQSIPVPNYHPPGYSVKYEASMELIEVPKPGFENSSVITQVKWQLNLEVAVQFPKFINKLPLSLIQSTGDRLLTQIVRQISPRLTYKVQQDFHASLNLPIPPKSSRQLWKVAGEEIKAA